jgi:hypothetical protein
MTPHPEYGFRRTPESHITWTTEDAARPGCVQSAGCEAAGMSAHESCKACEVGYHDLCFGNPILFGPCACLISAHQSQQVIQKVKDYA